jgi:hypothetical protein
MRAISLQHNDFSLSERSLSRGVSVPALELVRRVDADPASVALLLAGPAADGCAGDGASPAGEDSPSCVQAGPPLRSSLGFSSSVAVLRAGAVVGRGRLRVGADSAGGTELRATLTSPERDTEETRRALARFVRGLAETAEGRSSAA